MEYPFRDDEYTDLDRQTFEALAKHFSADPGKKKSRGRGMFAYDQERVQALSADELCALAPYALACNWAFDNMGEEEKKQFLSMMRNRGITRASFIDDMLDFEFSALGPESTQYIGMIGTAIEDEYKGRELLWSDSMTYNGFRHRWDEMRRKLGDENAGREQPFVREAVLNIGAQALTIDYSPEGLLYVLDDTGTVHEFTENQRTGAWHVKDHNDVYAHDRYGVCPAQTVIRVRARELFLMNGPEIERYDLHNIEESRQQHRKQALERWRQLDKPKSKVWYHDISFRDGNTFASTSEDHGLRSIIQFDEGRRIVYQGRYPHNPFGSGAFSDLTLRLGIFNGGLYFPEMNGISVLTSDGPREMLASYKQDENHIVNIDPITRFAFGDDFMIAAAAPK